MNDGDIRSAAPVDRHGAAGRPATRLARFLAQALGCVYPSDPFHRPYHLIPTSLVNKTSVTLFSLLLGLAAQAQAQTVPSPYRFIDPGQSLGIYGGYMWTDPGDLDLGPRDSPLFGARYGFRLSGPILAEGGLGYLPATRAVLDTVPSDTALQVVGEAGIDVLMVSVGLRFDITGSRTYRSFQPFLRLNGGLAVEVGGSSAANDALPADVQFDFGSTFYYQLGAGFEYFLRPTLSLRFDGALMRWKVETPRPFLFGQAAIQRPESEWTQNSLLSAGLTIRF